MTVSKHSEAQMIRALQQVEGGRSAEDVGREHGVSKHTIYAWKAKYGGMSVSEAQEAKRLREEKFQKVVSRGLQCVNVNFAITNCGGKP